MTLYFSWAYCSQPFWPVISVLVTQICILVSDEPTSCLTRRVLYIEFMNLLNFVEVDAPWIFENYWIIIEFLNCWIIELLRYWIWIFTHEFREYWILKCFTNWDYYERSSFCYCNRRSCFEVQITRFEVTKAGLRPWVGQLLLQTSLTTLPWFWSYKVAESGRTFSVWALRILVGSTCVLAIAPVALDVEGVMFCFVGYFRR